MKRRCILISFQNRSFTIFLALLLFAKASTLYAQPTRYVKPVASGTGDGSSWANASSDLQLMINNSASGDFLFVAAGTYQASSGASYVMKEGVKIYGGFAGTETMLSQRNWTTNVTILRGNNAPVVRNFFNDLTPAAVIDGFTVTNGNAGGGPGGGMYNQSVNPTISNCIFTGNTAYWGGGMHNNSCSPTINNCTFSGNTGTEGGGMYNNPRVPDIHNCTFISNSATLGGGMYNYNIAGGTIGNCTISNNQAVLGAGMYNYNSTVLIQQTTFSGNNAYNNGGAGSGYGAGLYNNQNSNVTITGSTFQNNTAYRGGGAIFVLFSSCSFSDNYFTGNSAGVDGGALSISTSSSATITRCSFLQNTSSYIGGALTTSGDVDFNNCILSGNNSPSGGAVYLTGGIQSFTNCLLSGNTCSTRGSAVVSNGTTATFNNSTIAGNNGAVGCISSEGGAVTNINNSIIWGNSSAIANSASTINVQYSTVQGGYAGTGNQSADPQFLSLPSYTTAPFTGGDFHPSICSPVVNAGNNALVAAGNTSDLGSFQRIVGPAVDLGAYEYGIFPSASNIIYVNPSVIGGGNSGASWNNAKRSLAEVLRYVKANENLWTPANPLKIFVAKGKHTPLYRPDNPCSSVNPNDRNNTFLMVNNVNLYGGFDPVNGIDDLSDSRIFGINGSVLSGDIGLPINLSDNSYHVVLFSGTGNSAGLDGFTITAGTADGIGTVQANGATIERNNGGGVYLDNSSPSFPNCSFQFNSSSNFGGALYSTAGSGFTAGNCTFTNNSSVYGGAIFNNNTTGTVSNSLFQSNTAPYGAAIFDHNGGSTSVTGSSFNINSSAALGGAVYINANSVPLYSNCTFTGNTSSIDGGAVFNNNSTPTFTTCTFSGNSANQNGGAVYNYQTTNPTFNNCSFSNNTAISFGGAMYSEVAANPKLRRCDFSANSSAFGGALANVAPASVESCSFTNNQAASYGGAVYNLGPQQVFSNCVFSGNQAINVGGGGGAVFNNFITGSTSIINSVFYNNTSTFGGAVHNWSSASVNITNSIIWNNSSAVYNESAASAAVQNTLIQGGYAGPGNINADPLFINASQPKGADGIWATNDDGFHVQPCSPAINAGVNGAIAIGVTTDLSSQPRIQYSIADMGAYEANSLANNNAAAIVTSNTTASAWQLPNAKTFYAANCATLIASVMGDATATSISGNTTVKVWMETAQPNDFVKRHYEIAPQTNPTTSTATVTLYFTQAEFDAFNAVNTVKLPQGPSDAAGKANLLVEKRSGTSSNGTGLPLTYSGTAVTLNPADADIIWNATASRWEISFPVTGFSGFFVKTKLFTLPLRLVSFNAEEKNCVATLRWITKDEVSVSHFELEQSTDGTVFSTVKTIAAKNAGNENNYTVSLPVMDNKMFYRLKMVDIDGKITYSAVNSITTVCGNRMLVYPNPAKDKLYIRNAGVGSTYMIYDNTGKRISSGHVVSAVQEVSMAGIAAGVYVVSISENGGNGLNLRFMKE